MILENNDRFIKDSESGVVINNDYNDYLKIVEARKEAKKNKQILDRVEYLEKQVALLSSKLSDRS